MPKYKINFGYQDYNTVNLTLINQQNIDQTFPSSEIKMPIIVKDFTWKQTLNKICLSVPIHNVPPSNVNIFTSPQYLKLTFEAFFFEVILFKPINVVLSSCTKTEECVVFDLEKEKGEMWDFLEVPGLSKQEKMELKMRLIDEEHQRVQKKSEERLNKKAELKRVAINEQIKLDTKMREKIQEIKKSEEMKALGDLNIWKEEVEVNLSKEKIMDIHKEKEIAPSCKSDKALVRTKSKPKMCKEPTNKPVIPKPRNIQSLQILFTPREFPTPCRESRLAEENEFLSKQAEARRSAGFYDKDLRPEEKNPQYLLNKAREFKKHKNYLGAISALTFAIKLSPEFVDLYYERSEVHMLIGNFGRAVDDCTKALNLYKPPSAINLHERAVCIGRRGIGLVKLGFFKQGVSELQASIKLEKNDEFVNALAEYEEELKTERDVGKKMLNEE